MHRLGYAIVVGSTALMAASSVEAQVRARVPQYPSRTTQPYPSGTSASSQSIPPGQMPPAGMCRIWIDGVPPGRQPAPTDCATARANVPANGRVIYGDRTHGGVYGGTGQYDPRLDPRSPQYDPRLDPRNRSGNGRWD